MEFENSVNDEQLDTVGQQETGDEASDKGEVAGSADQHRAQQDRRFNAAMRAARQRAEEETTRRMRQETDNEIAGMRIPNPQRPGSYFESLEEMRRYSGSIRQADAQERAKKENRSVEEVLQDDEDKAYVRRKRAEDAKAEAAARRKKESEAFIAADVEDFMSRFPDVDIEKLDANKQFRRFAGSRYGKEHLADLYEDFIAISGEASAAAASRITDRADRSTGSGDGKTSGALTASQKRQLKEWNENNPDMRMTEAEFLSR